MEITSAQRACMYVTNDYTRRNVVPHFKNDTLFSNLFQVHFIAFNAVF